MDAKKSTYLGTVLNIPSFWKKQMSDWKVTVVRTSLERLGYQIIFPYLSIYIIALGASKTELGMITSIGMVLAGLLAPLTGNLIDRNGAKRLYIIGIALLALSYVTYALAPVWQICAVAMLVYYLGQGTGIHSCATICGNCLVNKDRAKGTMICESIAAGLLGMVGPMIAAWFLVSIMKVPSGADPTASDIRPLFAITAGITVISLIVVLTKLSNKKWTSSSTRGFNLFKDSKAILKGNKNAQKWLAIGALGQLPMGMVIPFWQVFAQEAKGANVVVLSGMVTAAAITSIIFGYPIGALADKIGRKKVLYIIIPLFWLSVVTLIVSPSPVFLIIAGILQGFMHIAGPLTAAIQRELVTVEFMGRWIGINRLISAIIGAIMAFVGGIIADKAGIQYVFLIFIAADVLIRMPLLISMPETLKYQASIKSEE